MNASSNVSPVLATQVSPASPVTGSEFGASKNPRSANQHAQYRLVIEEGPQKGSFVYKTLDRTTGEVIQQFPREEVVRMLSDESYSEGSVFNTSA